MTSVLTLEAWLEAAIGALNEVATSSLGTAPIERSEGSMPEEAGAFLPLFSDHESIHVGLFSTRAGAAALPRSLLGMGPEDELSDSDIADAVGEIVNIFGGVMQRALHGELKRVDLGLPVFIWGLVAPTERLKRLDGGVMIGDVPAKLILLRGAVELPGGKG